MNTARVVIKRDGTVTLNGRWWGSVSVTRERGRAILFTWHPGSTGNPLGGTFSKRTKAEVYREFYRHLNIPLSGR